MATHIRVTWYDHNRGEKMQQRHLHSAGEALMFVSHLRQVATVHSYATGTDQTFDVYQRDRAGAWRFCFSGPVVVPKFS